MTSAEERFISSRIHWGAHLPPPIIDGLKKLKEGTIDAPGRKELQKLFDALLVLETRRTIEGQHLYEEIPQDREKIVGTLGTVCSILYPLCGWE
jgi:hypothetical protein